MEKKKKRFLNWAKRQFTPFNIIIFAILTLYLLVLVSMFVWAFVNSLRSTLNFSLNPIGFSPIEQAKIDASTDIFATLKEIYKFENYETIFKNLKSGNPLVAKSNQYYLDSMFMFSALYAIGCTAANILCMSIMAYACTMFPCKLSRAIEAYVIFSMVFPIIGAGPSQMNVMRSLGLYNNFLGIYFVSFGFGGTYFLVLTAAFRGVPKDYKEAAELDGASMLTIMVSIMFRMVSNILGAIFIVSFIGYWNDYSTPLLYLPSYPTMAAGLANFIGSTSGPIAGEPFKFGAAMICVLPLLVFFIIFQKRLMGNITAGGIKM